MHITATEKTDNLFYPEAILLSRKLSQILIGILDARLLFKMSGKKNLESKISCDIQHCFQYKTVS